MKTCQKIGPIEETVYGVSAQQSLTGQKGYGSVLLQHLSGKIRHNTDRMYLHQSNNFMNGFCSFT